MLPIYEAYKKYGFLKALELALTWTVFTVWVVWLNLPTKPVHPKHNQDEPEK